MPSLFEQIGGLPKVGRIVDQFYQFVLADERINHYWVDYVSDIPAIHTNMAHYMAQVLGGPQLYTGKGMHEAHKDLQLKTEEFGVIWEHIENAMLVQNVPQQLIRQVKKIVDSTYEEIFPPE